MTRRRLGSAGLLALALTIVVGCGSDAKLTSSSTATSTASTAAAAASGPTAGSVPATVITPGSTNTGPPATDGASSPTAATSTTTGDVDPALDDDIQTATTDLASHLGIDESTIETVSATTTEWPNGALGCPKPGMSYTQVPVDGAEIVLLAGGKRYSYHEGGSTGPFLCEQATAITPGSSSRSSTPTLPGG